MAYANNYVVSIIHNDKPIRESNVNGERTARLPFDSEYKIRLKNKTSRRAIVKIDIDGTDILGSDLVLNGGQTLDLERFLTSDKKLKFMSVEKGARTGEIQDPTNEDNGLINVQFYAEMASCVTYPRKEYDKEGRPPYPSYTFYPQCSNSGGQDRKSVV